MNSLNQPEQDAAVRCITQVAQHGGEATETLPTGDVAYACQEKGDRISWSVTRIARPRRIDAGA